MTPPELAFTHQTLLALNSHDLRVYTAGSYLFEPGGSIHTFNVPADNKKPTETLMVISGSRGNFEQDGNYPGMLDANPTVIVMDHLVRERGLDSPNTSRRRSRAAHGRTTTRQVLQAHARKVRAA